MKKILLLFVSGIFLFSFINIVPKNNTAPGCSGRGCHLFESNLVTVVPLNNLQFQVTVNGVKAGKKVGGELVDIQGKVVDFVGKTKTNPFILSAPRSGEYTINAGFEKLTLKWDSVKVNLAATNLCFPAPARTRCSFELYPNHPNPFEKETIIKFSLPKAANIELKIFTINGGVIRHLAQGYYQAGVHYVRWDGRDDFGRPSRSGVYLYEIKSKAHCIARRMDLLK